MNEYNRVNGNEDDESPQSLLNNDDQQMIVSASPQTIWPNTPISCIIPTTSKLGDTSPNSPGAYYATIQSTSSRWYACFRSLFLPIIQMRNPLVFLWYPLQIQLTTKLNSLCCTKMLHLHGQMSFSINGNTIWMRLHRYLFSIHGWLIRPLYLAIR